MIELATKEFRASVRLEGSWGASAWSKPITQTMVLYMENPQADTGMIEWDIPGIEHTEHIRLWFDRDEDGKLVLTEYDGVMSFPTQAVELLEDFGVKVGRDFR